MFVSLCVCFVCGVCVRVCVWCMCVVVCVVCECVCVVSVCMCVWKSVGWFVVCVCEVCGSEWCVV